MKPGKHAHLIACSALAITLLALTVPAAQGVDTSNSRLVTTEWLQGHMRDADLRIIDVRANVQDYWAGHIPGAVYLSPDAVRLPDGGVPVMLAPAHILGPIVGRLGANGQTMVVIYAEKSDFKPAYLLWALDSLGHKRSAILDGGFGKWQAESRPLTQDYPEIKSVSYRVRTRSDKDVRARLDDVKRVVQQDGAVLLDVRPLELYTGEKGSWKRNGHIPGAVHYFWGDSLKDDGTWKSPEELRAAYAKIGVTSDKEIIVSCGQGQMSAHTYFTLKYLLGFPKVRNYDGSFNEWSNIDSLPVEKGIR